MLSGNTLNISFQEFANESFYNTKTARNAGLDSCIQVFIGCPYPSQTWALTNK
jgi:hypothetical protein